MKIGELFIALGFKVDGEPLDQTERRMEAAAIKAGKLALVVNAVNAAMLAMVDYAMRAAVSLRIWENSTGGSADELQRWGQAARIAGIQADDLKKAVESLQDARNAFALGEPQNVGAWSILGVDPTQDPFTVLKGLRARLAASKDANLMRGLLGKVGMAGIMPLLQAPAADFAKLERTIISRNQIDRLVELNREWQRLVVNLGAIKNQISAGLAPALRMLATGLGMVANWLTIASNYLSSSSTGAAVARFVLGALAIAFLALGAAIAIVAAGLAGLAALLALMSPALIAVGVAAAPFLAVLALIGAAIAAVILLVDDFWSAADGGDHVFDWSTSLKAVDLMAKGFEKLIWLWDKLVAGFKAGQRGFEFLFGGTGGNGWAWGPFGQAWNGTPGDIARQNQDNKGSAWFAPKMGGAGGSWSQENKVEINVDGAQSPQDTANAVNRTIKRELENAGYQMPVPNY